MYICNVICKKNQVYEPAVLHAEIELAVTVEPPIEPQLLLAVPDIVKEKIVKKNKEKAKNTVVV